MFEFDIIQCGLFVLILMVAGEGISKKMKAVIPSILASSLLFLILMWTHVLPSTLIDDSGLISLASIAMMFVITGMGISTNPKELIDNWRVVALAALTYIGQTLILLIVISLVFDRNTALGALPGGAAVALIVQEHARELGYENIVVFSVLLVSIQGLAACPLVSWMLRKEVVHYQKIKEKTNTSKTDTYIKDIAVKGETDGAASPYWSILRFYVVAWIASRLEICTGISKYVFCLILGILLTKLGFFRKNEMDRSKSHGFLSLMMMTSVINGFSRSTPDMFLELMKPLVCVLLVDVVSIFVLSRFIGKFLKFSKQMSFAIGLNVMVGFPLNLMLAQDIINFLATSPEENEILNQQIASKMVIAGFTSVTFLSTIGAGVLVGLMK